MFSPVTKWADVVLTPGAVPEMVRKAFKLAQTERPGAVYLAVPEDVEAMGVPEGVAPLNLNIPRPDEPSGSQIERAAAVLDSDRQCPGRLEGGGRQVAGRQAAANPDTIVVLETGNPVVMPWRDHKRCRSWVAGVLAAGVTPGRHGPSAAGLPV
jgi:glyoxylate carboligase